MNIINDYKEDRYAKACLTEAEKGKSDMRFGSILVKNKRIIGRGWNRLSTKEERARLSHIDYAIHGEQAAILNAIDNGYNPEGATCYVLGYVATGKNKGKFSIREVVHLLIIK